MASTPLMNPRRFSKISQRHPRYPIRVDTTIDLNIKSFPTPFSNHSTQFLFSAPRYSNSFFGHVKDWSLEILCLVIAITSLLAIILVLLLSDGRQQPKLPFAISLNSLISYIGVVLKAMLLGVVSSSLGQLKWCWFTDRHGLEHFDILDAVSHSPLAAVLLLFSWKPYRWIYLGALVMLLTAFIDPFLQQSVTNPLTIVRHGEATMPRAQIYDAGGDLGAFAGGLLGEFDFGLKAALYRGLFAPESPSEAQYECPTGNCTFPNFDTLAFCSKCVNITGSVKTADNPFFDESQDGEVPANYTFTIPYAAPITINTFLRYVGQVSAGPALISESFPTNMSEAAIGVVNPLLAFSMLHWGQLDTTSNTNNDTGNYSTQLPEAYQCALYFCLNTYSADVQGNELTTSILSTFAPVNGTPLGSNDTVFDEFAKVSDLVFQRPATSSITDGNSTFWVPSSTIGILASYLQHFFTGYQQIQATDAFLVDTTEDNNAFPLPFLNDTMTVFSNQTNANVPAIMEGVATTMTNYIRTNGQSQQDNLVSGTAYTLRPLVRVVWEWLALPSVLIVLATGLLLYTAIVSAKLGIPAWKDSALPMLFHGLDEVTLHSMAVTNGSTMKRAEMIAVAKKTTVNLETKMTGDMKLSE